MENVKYQVYASGRELRTFSDYEDAMDYLKSLPSPETSTFALVFEPHRDGEGGDR